MTNSFGNPFIELFRKINCKLGIIRLLANDFRVIGKNKIAILGNSPRSSSDQKMTITIHYMVEVNGKFDIRTWHHTSI